MASLGLSSVVLLVVATSHLLRTATPLVDLRTLRIPTFGNAMVGSSLIWLVIGAIPFLPLALVSGAARSVSMTRTAVALRLHPSAGDVLTADGGIAGSPTTTSTPRPG